MAYLRLYWEYNIRSAIGRKPSEQRCGSFRILRKIGCLVYEVEFPEHWRIHPVISVVHLEPAPTPNDPYERERPDHPESVFVEGDTEFIKSFEVEKIVMKRITPTGRSRYLLRWKGYEPTFDSRKYRSQLPNAQELIEEFKAR